MTEIIRTLTIEQRAKRRVGRINRKVSEKFPLFADQFSTSIEAEITNIIKLDAENKLYFAQMSEHSVKAWEESLLVKEQARKIMTAEMFTDYESRYERIYGTRGEYAKPEHVGAFALDWWHCAVKKCQKN